MIESQGVPTVTIGLVRPHMEATRPPRGLWAPFQLGRPLGEPGDAAFQRRVLLRALALLERADGPVLLEDYEEDAPGRLDRPGWAPPALPAPAAPDSPAAWPDALAAEMALVAPWWHRFQARYGRTTVGLCPLPPEAFPAYAAGFLDGRLPEGEPPAGHAGSHALALRYLADDLKSLYLEAAQAEGDPPSSRQAEGWLYHGTVAGALLVALRAAALASEVKGLQTVSRFLVPAPWLPR